MKNWGLLLIELFCLCSCNVHQGEINQLDHLNHKQGLWIDTANDWIIHSYYVNDTLDSSFVIYHLKTGSKIQEGQYQMGERIGVWSFFDNQGHLYATEYERKINLDLELRNYGSGYKPKYISQVKLFNRQGNYLEEEGLMLYSESFDSDEALRHGRWLFYNQFGEVRDTIVFFGGKVVK